MLAPTAYAALAAPACAQAASAPPRVVRVLGRPCSHENGDICGEYTLGGMHLGQPMYEKPSGALVIRFLPTADRWCIHRADQRDPTICVAYADAATSGGGRATHPGNAELYWHVWEDVRRAHVPDVRLVATDAPPKLSIAGRAAAAEHSEMNGEYALCGVHHGRPLYRQRSGELAIRYFNQHRLWIVARWDQVGAAGIACAQEGAYGLGHPGHPDLQWSCWSSQQPGIGSNAWFHDHQVTCLAVPNVVHIIGRARDAEHSRINGSYHLAGACDGKPMYISHGTGFLIRYSSSVGGWLLGQRQQAPGAWRGGGAMHMLSRFLGGSIANESHEEDSFAAFAPSQDSEHPGAAGLEWLVWEPRAGNYVADAAVVATAASLAVEINGRAPGRENDDIVGVYMLSGSHFGRPAYLKNDGSGLAIYYWAPSRRWVVSRDGIKSSDVCVAWAENTKDDLDPVGETLQWQVYESVRDCHCYDPDLRLFVSVNAPALLDTDDGMHTRAPLSPHEQGSAGKSGWMEDAARPSMNRTAFFGGA